VITCFVRLFKRLHILSYKETTWFNGLLAGLVVTAKLGKCTNLYYGGEGTQLVVFTEVL
jgi:hypothetical protein